MKNLKNYNCTITKKTLIHMDCIEFEKLCRDVFGDAFSNIEYDDGFIEIWLDEDKITDPVLAENYDENSRTTILRELTRYLKVKSVSPIKYTVPADLDYPTVITIACKE